MMIGKITEGEGQGEFLQGTKKALALKFQFLVKLHTYHTERIKHHGFLKLC